jgi:hypothetical protein
LGPISRRGKTRESFFIWIRCNSLKRPDSAKGNQGNPSVGGTSTAHTKTKATLRRSIAHGKGTPAGSLACQTACTPSRTCALLTSTTATTVILSSVQDDPQSIRLATCLDRSAAASGAIASMVSPCLPWRKLLSLTERLTLLERPRRRAAYRAGASRRTGLSPSGDPAGEWRAVDSRRRGSDDRGEGMAELKDDRGRVARAGAARRGGAPASR